MEQGEGGDRLQNKKAVILLHQQDGGNSSLLNSGIEADNIGLNKPLSFFGCGIGWFCFTFGVFLPLLWYYATYLYFRNYYLKDPRERAGLAASAIAALVFSVILFIVLIALLC